MPVITITHWAYLIVVLAIVAAMFMRRGVVMIATIGIFVIGFLHSGSLIRTIQIAFGAFEVAGTDLFDIMLVIALMVAMLRTMESLGADYLMVSPIKKVLGNPTVGFFALGFIMYVCALFFCPRRPQLW